MNRWQRIAWFNLIVTAAAFVICIVMAASISPAKAITPPSPLSPVIIPALVLVAVSEKVIFRKKAELVDRDERDRQIENKSGYIGWMAFALAVVVQLTVCSVAIGPRGVIHPVLLPLMACIGGGILIMVASSATLIQYAWGGGSHE
jgi:hypothetical protein